MHGKGKWSLKKEKKGFKLLSINKIHISFVDLYTTEWYTFGRDLNFMAVNNGATLYNTC